MFPKGNHGPSFGNASDKVGFNFEIDCVVVGELAGKAGGFFCGADAVTFGPLIIVDKKITPTVAKNNSTAPAPAIPTINGQGVERFFDPATPLFATLGML